MYNWFQNLNDNGNRLFHFRGSLGSTWENKWFKYELVSGPACRLSMEPCENKTRFIIGAFLFSVYFTIYDLRIPLITKGREYGFYFYEWTLNVFFGSKPWSSSSSDPWYYNMRLDIPEFLFGKMRYFSEVKIQNYSSPIHFQFRGNEYQAEHVDVSNDYWFRERIPFFIWHTMIPRIKIEIANPPKRAGKGENSWDCGDDGSYGLTCAYGDGPEINWKNEPAIFEHCIWTYCQHVMKNIVKYGRASNDEYHRNMHGFKYIGKKIKSDCNASSVK